jgi:TolB-like protein/Flp pilus assembly protein TadD
VRDTQAEDPPQTPAGAAESPGAEAPVSDAVEGHWILSLWARIKEHKIAQWTIGYAAFAFALLHAATLLREALEWPHAIVRVLTLVLMIGLLIAPILAWYHGVRALKRVSISELILIVLLLGIGGLLLWRSPRPESEHADASEAGPARAGAAKTESVAGILPPAHSVAVLPFVNMSGDAQQDYFSDGLSEELLNSLTRVAQLQVAARTSSFSFKGKEVDIADIAHKLNVGAVLEGSVRKDGARVRITAQLINAVTGFHLWSQTYDRDLHDILALQTEIAGAVTTALQATLLADSAALIELGGTQNPLAFDAYLRGQKFDSANLDKERWSALFAAYAEAIRLDPLYAKAYVGQAGALASFAGNEASGAAIRERFEEARASAEKAAALAPNLGEAHAALAFVLYEGFADYARAAVEYDRALVLSPGNARILRTSANFFAVMGRTEAAVANAQRSVAMDPLNVFGHRSLGLVLHYGHRDREAIDAYNRALTLDPHTPQVYAIRGYAYLAVGEFEAARASCATPPVDWDGNTCLAIAYRKLNRQSDADATLAALIATYGDDMAVQYAEIYAQWGNIPKALEWLDTAYRTRDPGLLELKAEPTLDPLRQEPRFQEMVRKLKFPD